jgi:hygromycin-B 4-O-kinase
VKIKPSISRLRIESALAHITGGVCSLVPTPQGEESQTFSFHHRGGDYVARVNESDGGFKKDLFAYENFTKPELPIPEILHIGPLDDQYVICVSRRAPGVTLQGLSAAALPQTVEATARVMDAIAVSNVDKIAGFGRFEANGTGQDQSWRGFLAGIGDTGRYDWNLASRNVNMRLVNRLMRVVERFAEHCPEERKLVHGDFGSNNVLTDAGEITAVIDWSEALLGDPLYDVANIFFWRNWLACMEVQARYFESRLSGVPQSDERMLCYQLRIGLEEIYENAIDGNTKKAAWASNRCLEIAEQAVPHW